MLSDFIFRYDVLGLTLPTPRSTRAWLWTCLLLFPLFFPPSLLCLPLVYSVVLTSSTAQGGGGSFKNRKPIGKAGCWESGMTERNHWWSDTSLLFLSLCFSFSDYLPTYLPIYLSSYLSIYLSTYLPTYLPIYLSIYLPIYLPVYLSIHLSIYLFIYLSIYLVTYLSIYLVTYLSIYLVTYLSIYLFIYLSIHPSVHLPIYLSFYLSIYLPI